MKGAGTTQRQGKWCLVNDAAVDIDGVEADRVRDVADADHEREADDSAKKAEGLVFDLFLLLSGLETASDDGSRRHGKISSQLHNALIEGETQGAGKVYVKEHRKRGFVFTRICEESFGLIRSLLSCQNCPFIRFVFYFQTMLTI